MSKPPSVTQAEWEVMRVLWERSPLAANEVVDAVAVRMKWNAGTVKTPLNRLVKKSALGFKAEGNRYFYRPNVTEEECVREESRSFVARVFGGNPGAMLCRFVDDIELTPQDIAELQKILKRKGK